jgi:hypothetical protein
VSDGTRAIAGTLTEKPRPDYAAESLEDAERVVAVDPVRHMNAAQRIDPEGMDSAVIGSSALFLALS